jgi:hypothetical protein
MVRIWLLVAVAAGACATAGGSDVDARAGDSTSTDVAIDMNNCAQQPCSIIPQCGCATTDACDLDTTDNNGTVCRPVTTPGTITATCNSLDDCEKGYVCLGGAAYAACKKYCTGDIDCGTPRGKCALNISSGGMPVMGVPTVCTSNCDPTSTNPAECPSTFKCGLFTAMHMGTTYDVADCSPAGTGMQGFNCKSGTLGNDSLCAKGFLCTTIDMGTTYTCRKICTNPMAGSAQCGGQTCIAFSDPYTLPDNITYGVCAP